MTAYNYSQIVPFNGQNPVFEVGNDYSIDFEYVLTGALSSGDTITTPAGALPSDGIRILEVEVIAPETDTNATPTGTFDVGDSGDADRFIDGIPMGVAGVTTAGYQMRQGINIAQGTTNGVVSSGVGYLYGQGTTPQLITTVASAVATGATTGVIRKRVFFRCTSEQ